MYNDDIPVTLVHSDLVHVFQVRRDPRLELVGSNLEITAIGQKPYLQYILVSLACILVYQKIIIFDWKLLVTVKKGTPQWILSICFLNNYGIESKMFLYLIEIFLDSQQNYRKVCKKLDFSPNNILQY